MNSWGRWTTCNPDPIVLSPFGPVPSAAAPTTLVEADAGAEEALLPVASLVPSATRNSAFTNDRAGHGSASL